MPELHQIPGEDAMRRLLWWSVMIFVLSSALFGFYQYRRVTRTDSSGPQIRMGAERISISVEDGEEALLADVTASDKRDGDVTNTLVVEGQSNILDSETRSVTYAAFDSDQHVTRVSGAGAYTDYRDPEFSISGPLSFAPGTKEILNSVKVSDCLDGDLSDRVKVLADEGLTVDRPGLYPVRFQVANSAGDVVNLPVVVEIREGTGYTGPQIRLTQYAYYLDPGESFDPKTLIESVTISGRTYEIVDGAGNYFAEDRERDEKVVIGRDSIEVDNPVQPETPGTYTLTYSMTITNSDQENVTGSVRLFVTVREA